MDIQIKSQPFTKYELKKIKNDFYSGRLRRFGAIVHHQKLNYSYNALIAWNKQSLSRKLTLQLKEKDYISHIYLRQARRIWPFGLYTMIHASSDEQLNLYIQELFQLLSAARRGGSVNSYGRSRCKFKALKTIKEYKKISFNPYI